MFSIEDTEGEDIPTGDAALDNWIAVLPFREVAESWDITVCTFDGEGHLSTTVPQRGSVDPFPVQFTFVNLLQELEELKRV